MGLEVPRLQVVSPTVFWRVSEFFFCFFEAKESLEFGQLLFYGNFGEAFLHQGGGRSVHNRIGCSDREVGCTGYICFESDAAALSGVSRIDVAPEVPDSLLRVVPIARYIFVVFRSEDVCEAKSNDWDIAPAIELAGHLFAY